MSQLTPAALKKLAKEISLLTLDLSYKGQVGHVGSALSIIEILTALYFSKLNITKQNLKAANRDRFVLSKGHAAAALYATLYKKGIISEKLLASFARNSSGLNEHPEISYPGVEMSSGSLGHGLAFGIGCALGLKSNRSLARVFVLISDGECDEGSTWEAALLAPQLKLDNLTVILDYNGWQCFGAIKKIVDLEPLKAKWEAFNWSVAEVDGHNLRQLTQILHKSPFTKGKPSMIIAQTKSGRGISQIEDKLIGHYHKFSEAEYKQARKELLGR